MSFIIFIIYYLLNIDHSLILCIIIINIIYRFRIEPVRLIISQVLESKLYKRKYNPKEAPILIKEICNEIQAQVKGKFSNK